MNIGIDIDGVLTNLLGGVKKEYKKFSKLKNGRTVYKREAKSLAELFGVTESQDVEFFVDYIWVYAEKVKYYRLPKKYIRLLHKQGHKLIIITAREYAGQDSAKGAQMRAIVERGLAKAGIYYDKIFYTSEIKTKVPVIKEEKIDVFIDDYTSNIQEISQHIPVICYNQRYNKTYQQKGLRRANNWKEVYKHIIDLQKEGEKIENK